MTGEVSMRRAGGQNGITPVKQHESIEQPAAPSPPKSLQVGNPPASAPIVKLVRSVASQWNDDNISSGGIVLRAGTIRGFKGAVTSGLLPPVALTRMEAFFQNDQGRPIDGTRGSTSYSNVGPVISDAARKLASDGFGYTPGNAASRAVRQMLTEIVDALGPRAGLVAGSAGGRTILNPIDTFGDVSYYIFANRKTGVCVEVFVREGSM